MKNFLVIFLLFSACSVVDEEMFYYKATGDYILNATGARFLNKVAGFEECPEDEEDNNTGDDEDEEEYDCDDGYDGIYAGDYINFLDSGILCLVYNYSNGESKTIAPIASLVSLEKPYLGIFKFCNSESYVAMGLDDGKWVSTTNVKSSPDEVLFEHLIPIATKND